MKQKGFIQEALDLVSKHIQEPRVIEMFKNAMEHTLDHAIEFLEDERVFVITGDIPAMWLRDSVNQLRPYLLFCKKHEQLQKIFLGLMRTLFQFIQKDPYANAFNKEAEGLGNQNDLTDMKPFLWERKYEIDSLCYPFQLAYLFWRVTGVTQHFDDDFLNALNCALEVWICEQDHETKSVYRFQRLNAPLSDTLDREGKGSPVALTGLTWSGFRPSDDACQYGYLIPSNMFLVVVLSYLEEIISMVYSDKEILKKIILLKDSIQEGLARYAKVEVNGFGQIYAYEVDGLGNYNLMDDANAPSLLSLPYFGYCDKNDEIYQNTRKFILSDQNPYYYEGRYAKGIGSPHTQKGYVWPLALAIQGLTAMSKEEKYEMLLMMASTDAGTNILHEAFDPNQPEKFSREWFSWANAMFCELTLDYCGLKIENLI